MVSLALVVIALALAFARYTNCSAADVKTTAVMLVGLASACFWALSAGISWEDPATVEAGSRQRRLLDLTGKLANFLAAVLTGAAVLMQAAYSGDCPTPCVGRAMSSQGVANSNADCAAPRPGARK